jgi:hypothetical protein
MKGRWILLFITITTAASVRDFGDLARSERRRQQKVAPRRVLVEIRTPRADPPEDKPQATASAKSEPEKPLESSIAPEPISTEIIQFAQLQQEKELLLQPWNVIHDRKAVDALEQRLAVMQQRSVEPGQAILKASHNT